MSRRVVEIRRLRRAMLLTGSRMLLPGWRLLARRWRTMRWNEAPTLMRGFVFASLAINVDCTHSGSNCDA